MYKESIEQTDKNIKLLKLVKKHKCIYDLNDEFYRSRQKSTQHVELAWNAIAKECGDTVPNCKKKWRHLRSSLSRYLKSVKEDRKMRPYYLLEHMEFVIPYTKTLDNKNTSIEMLEENLMYDDSIIKKEPPSKEQEEDENMTYETFKFEDKEHMETEITFLRSQNSTANSYMPELKSFVNSTISTTMDYAENLENDETQNIKATEETEATQQDAIIPIVVEQNCADLNFFLSLQPEMKQLDESQKRKLRIGILKLIDQLLCKEI